MKRTVSLKLILSAEQAEFLLQTQVNFAKGCNAIASHAQENRCWNQVGLHNLSYSKVRSQIPQLGSQMVCNAIRKVCSSYKVLKIKKKQEVPHIVFKETSSIHYCARTFSLKGETLSLFSVNKRIRCSFKLGEHQKKYLVCGKMKEGELIRKKKRWFFNIVLDLAEVSPKSEGEVFAKLTLIRKRIRGNKRLRTRLHRWPWKELQNFVEYKANAQGIQVVYVNPQYTSLTCSGCESVGKRHKHLFKCSNCGSYQHSDRNAAINFCKLAKTAVLATAPVNVPMVATAWASYKLLPLEE